MRWQEEQRGGDGRYTDASLKHQAKPVASTQCYDRVRNKTSCPLHAYVCVALFPRPFFFLSVNAPALLLSGSITPYSKIFASISPHNT